MASLKWLRSSKLCRWPVQPGSRLSPTLRMAVYAVAGVATEVTITALLNYFLLFDRKLYGNSSLWSLLHYGVGFLGVDLLYRRLSVSQRLITRAVVYAGWLGLFQLALGTVLDAFDARPWDLSLLEFSVNGSAALELLPLLYVASILLELLLVRPLRALIWSDDSGVSMVMPEDEQSLV